MNPNPVRLALLLLTITETARGIISDTRKEELINRDFPSNPIFVRDVTEEERLWMLQTLRERLEKLGEQHQPQLFRLGDEKWTHLYIKRWNDGSQVYGDDIEESGRPELIPMIVPSLFREQPFKYHGTDSPSLPISYNTAFLMTGIIIESRRFSEDVLNWAQSMGPKSDDGIVEVRNIVREWWNQNKAYFDEKNYKAVQPGRRLAQKFIEHAEDIEERELIATQTSEAQNRPTNPPSVDTTDKPTASRNVASPAWVFWIAGAFCSLLAGGILWFLKATRG